MSLASILICYPFKPIVANVNTLQRPHCINHSCLFFNCDDINMPKDNISNKISRFL